MKFYIGTDIVEIDRIRRIGGKHPQSFIERIYTEAERLRIADLEDPTSFMAGRWAAKEAIYKLLSTEAGFGVGWKDMSIERLSSGQPVVKLSGKAKERALQLGLGPIEISISHCRDYAVAYTHAFAESSVESEL